jgi:tetratricopeptide (TPR) repeat protein
LSLYGQWNRADLALQQVEWILANWDAPADDQQSESQRRLLEADRDALTKRVKEVRTAVDKLLTQKVPVVDAAAQAFQQGGCVLVALDLLRDVSDDQMMRGNGELALLKASLLVECGRIPEAVEVLNLAEAALQNPTPTLQQFPWRQQVAFVELVLGRHDNAAQIFEAEAERIQWGAFTDVLGTFPLAARTTEPTPWFLNVEEQWPLIQSALGQRLLYDVPHHVSRMLYEAALTWLEAGRPDKAGELFRRCLEVNPEMPERVLLAFYLSQISGEEVPFRPPSADVPVWPGMFADGPAVAEEPE